MLIGLTGGIASGKTTIAKMITDLGIPVIDADRVAREVVEPGSETLAEIASYFGSTVLNEDGSLARKKLGSIIFANDQKRKALNDIIHPAIRRRMNTLKDEYIEAGMETIVFDIPLLYENNLFHMVDRVLLVYVDYDTQLNRLIARDQMGMADAKQRIQSQMPLEDKKEKADAIIYNTGTVVESKQQLYDILQSWAVISS